jgi:hypothetical protein
MRQNWWPRRRQLSSVCLNPEAFGPDIRQGTHLPIVSTRENSKGGVWCDACRHQELLSLCQISTQK